MWGLGVLNNQWGTNIRGKSVIIESLIQVTQSPHATNVSIRIPWLIAFNSAIDGSNYTKRVPNCRTVAILNFGPEQIVVSFSTFCSTLFYCNIISFNHQYFRFNTIEIWSIHLWKKTPLNLLLLIPPTSPPRVIKIYGPHDILIVLLGWECRFFPFETCKHDFPSKLIISKYIPITHQNATI